MSRQNASDLEDSRGSYDNGKTERGLVRIFKNGALIGVVVMCFAVGYTFGFASLRRPSIPPATLKKARTCSAQDEAVVQERTNQRLVQLQNASQKELADELCESKLNAMDARFDLQRQGRVNNRPDPGQKIDAINYFDLYEPESSCYSEERFGTDIRFQAFGDGPKFVCGVDLIASDKNCLVYSVGSNNNIFFEKAVHQHMHCEIHTFDPTMGDMPFKGGEYSTFHDWGLGAEGEKMTFEKRKSEGTYSFKTIGFETLIKRLGHKGRKIDIIKIDCEGCEYSAMPPLFDAIARGDIEVDQILIEMHRRRGVDLEDFFDRMDAARMRIFHKERNHWGCQGKSCVEYAFVSESFLRRANEHFICPQ